MAETLTVPDMMCANCAATIRRVLTALDGVDDVEIDVEAKTVAVDGAADREALRAAVTKAGFTPDA